MVEDQGAKSDYEPNIMPSNAFHIAEGGGHEPLQQQAKVDGKRIFLVLIAHRVRIGFHIQWYPHGSQLQHAE